MLPCIFIYINIHTDIATICIVCTDIATIFCILRSDRFSPPRYRRVVGTDPAVTWEAVSPGLVHVSELVGLPPLLVECGEAEGALAVVVGS